MCSVSTGDGRRGQSPANVIIWQQRFYLVYSHPFVRSSTISSEHSASFYLSTCQDMAQSVLTEEWVLGPEGTPFYTKRVRMLFPISPPFFFPLVNQQADL